MKRVRTADNGEAIPDEGGEKGLCFLQHIQARS